MTTATVEIAPAFEFLFDPPLGSVRHRGAWGGRGGAKSWHFARALLIHGVEQPLRILCVREWQNSIKESVHHLLESQIEMMGLSGNYLVQEAAILGINGTEFIFKGLRRDLSAIKSLEGVNICWVEEAATVSRRSLEVLIPTIRREGSELWWTWNRDRDDDPIHTMLTAHAGDDTIVRKVTFRDNPWLPDTLRKEQEKSLADDPEGHEHVWEGGPWRRVKSSIFAEKCLIEDFTPQPHWQGPYFGADFGFSDDPAVLMKVWIHDRRLYLEHEQGGVKLLTDDLVRAYDRVPDVRKFVIRGDNARPETIAELARRGFRMEAAPKWPGSVQDGIEYLRNQFDHIVVHPRCERARQEAKLYRWKTDPNTGDNLPVPVDAHNHCWDSVRYALSPMIRHRGFGTVEVRYS